jgi:hypothetical protein
MLGSDRYKFHKKRAGTCDAELVFLHPVGGAGHVVHSGASGARNIDALFFLLGWDRYDSKKRALGHNTPNLCFSLRWDLRLK